MIISKEKLEELADAYSKQQNSAYTNDYYSFIEGLKTAHEIIIKTLQGD